MDNSEVIALLKDAFELKRQGKYKRAMELLYKALAICPDNSEILMQAAELHSLLENKTSAISLYEQLLAKNPSDVNIFSRLSNFYVRNFEFYKAKIFMTKFLLSYPSDKAYEVYFKALSDMGEFENIIAFYNDKNLAKIGSPILDKFYGEALCRTRRYEAAVSILGPIVNALKNDDDAKFYYAKALFEKNEVELAEKILMPLINHCNEAKIFNLAGEIEMRKNRIEPAVNLFAKAVKYKYEGLYFYNLASAYFLNGQLDEAKAFYVKAIAASPDVKEYRYAQAYLYYKEQNFKKAKQILGEIIAKQPDFKEAAALAAEILIEENKFFKALKTLGMFPCEKRDEDEEFLKLEVKIYKGLYRLEAAAESALKLLNLKPDSLDYKYDLACLYFDLGRFENSAKLVMEIIHTNGRYIDALVLAAKIYIKTFDFENSVKMADKVLALDVNNTDAYYLKALSLLGKGEFDRAIELSKTLLGYVPDKAEAFALIGACFTEKKEYETALRYYNEAVLLNSENADYFLNIALLHGRLGDTKEQIRYLYLAHVLKSDNREIILRLVEAYISTKEYKQALKLLIGQFNRVSETEIRKEIKSQINEVEELYKKSVNPLKYLCWKVFKI